MAWSNPRTWLAGETVTAALLNEQIRDNLKALGDPMTSYTPTWTASSANPALGDGTLVGAYSRVGRRMFFRIALTVGSTTTFGSGYWKFSPPATPVVGTDMPVGDCMVRDSSSTLRYGGMCYVDSGSTLAVVMNTDARLDAATIAWASGDVVYIAGTYEGS
jgi:hypothetical protein